VAELQFLYPLLSNISIWLMKQYCQKLTILLVALGMAIAQPGGGDELPAQAPVFSEAFCLKIFEEVAEKARSSSWQISDRDRHILTQCRTKFPPTVNSQIPLPTAAECVYVVKTLVEGGLSKVKEIELPEEQVKSIERCDEVLKYYSLPADNMLPTLKLKEKIVVDRIIYQTQSPQRGDIIVFNAPHPTQSEPIPQPLTRRAIGLPREKIKIKNGIVYINGKLYNEDYTTNSVGLNESISIPANKYLVLDDNRHNSVDLPVWSLIPREAIVGKVIWHFGSK
jgi:signal peptidase I